MRTIGMIKHTIAVAHILLPFTFVFVIVVVSQNTFAMGFVVVPLPFKSVSIEIEQLTIAMFLGFAGRDLRAAQEILFYP